MLQVRFESDVAIKRLYDKINRSNAELSELETHETVIEQATVLSVLHTQLAFKLKNYCI